MKHCPQCNRVETDDALVFCRADGTALISDSGSISGDAGTVKLGSAPVSSEIETSILPHTWTTPEINRSTGPTTTLPATKIPGTTRELSKPRRRGFVIVLASAIAVVIAVTGYFYFARNRGAAIESIAVLPFENRSDNSDTEYLSDGLADSLIYRLSQLPNLKVSPTSSVMKYKGKAPDIGGIAKELQVDAVMYGRLLQRGDDLSISVQLIDARSNKLIWAEQYERKMSELLATQREIAAEITNKLRLKLSGEGEQKLAKKYTDNNEAYQLYLKGRFYWNKRDEENIRKAIEQFKAAANKDPNYALAFVGLADCYAVLPFYSSTPSTEVLPQAKAYAERALEIDDSLGEAHTSLGYVNLNSWNWAEAEKEFKRGIELNPNYATAHKFYGNYLSDLGRNNEALAEYKRAQELEPLSLIISLNLAEEYSARGDLNAAFEQCKRAIDLDPNWYYIRHQLALVYLKQGRGADALAEAEKSVELSKRDSVPLATLGYVYAQVGNRNAATAIVEELKQRYAKRQSNGVEIARVYIGLGERDQCFAWLEKDFQTRNSTMPSWFYIVPFDVLRDDPQFKDLVKRMGMAE